MHWSDGRLPLLPFMALSFITSLAAAVLCWHLIEAPALRLKRYLPQPPPQTAGVAAASR